MSARLPSTTAIKVRSGFTLPEVMIAGTIALLAIGATLGTFVMGLRTMYRNCQRLETNAVLRQFLGHITTSSLDSTEFLLFPNYASLDNNVNLGTTWPASSLAEPVVSTLGSEHFLAQGDCLVLVKRLTLDPTAKIRRVRIYYRGSTTTSSQAPILFFERDFGTSGSADSLTTVLNGITLTLTESSSVRQVIDRSIGRRVPDSTTILPIFSAETPNGTTPSSASVALNVEVINGTTANNMLSSSSFNYVISPRK